MIKVLIVDDEPKLREGMRTLIPWEEQGYTVVATAANGYEALDRFHELAPGLVIADIRMPGMTGLELISELRKESPGCHVLILSGYADFEYAKQAISYHIDGYLLKPVDEEELISYLQELREKISLEERMNDWQALEPARTTEVRVRELLQSKEPAEAVAELGLADRNCEVVLLELKGLNKGEDLREEQVKRLLERHWQDQEERGLFFTLPPYMGLLLKEPLRDERARAGLWQELHHLVSKEGLEFIAAAGGIADRPEEASQSLAAASARLEDAFFGQKHTLLSGMPDQWEEPVSRPGALEEEQDPERDIEVQLLLAVEAGSSEVARELTRQIIRQLVHTRRDETYIKDNLLRIVSSTMARLEAANPEIRPLIAGQASPMSEVYSSGYLHDVERLVSGYLEQISRLTGSGSGRGDEIKRITDLIQRRYKENLKLGTLSEIFNYNSAYLGKMFKNQVGEHFNTYLDKVRIEKAKQLLTQGMKVYEVAEQVGYMNADYFNAKFRKYVGVSPSAFRKEN
ncbi:response regulator transcription factor [Paenibacillus tritici]|uniref:response regulator transcription factor n=1 Tax=Paenibacillus tritici TaxID=1873425 RepID=UPI001BA4FEAE|nr:response regulator transcription factor [Paenibacillus tritici]QUL54264.1 response regulator transcription factor [Paenibacillus tritici]